MHTQPVWGKKKRSIKNQQVLSSSYPLLMGYMFFDPAISTDPFPSGLPTLSSLFHLYHLQISCRNLLVTSHVELSALMQTKQKLEVVFFLFKISKQRRTIRVEQERYEILGKTFVQKKRNLFWWYKMKSNKYEQLANQTYHTQLKNYSLSVY